MGKSYNHWWDKQGKNIKKQQQKQRKAQIQEKENGMPIVTSRISPRATGTSIETRAKEPLRSYPTPVPTPANKNNGTAVNTFGTKQSNSLTDPWWEDEKYKKNSKPVTPGFVSHLKAPKTNPVFEINGIKFSGWAKADVKYFSGELLVSLVEHSIALPISMVGVDFVKEFGLTPMEQIKIIWPDFGDCPFSPEILYKLYQFLLRRGKNVNVHCLHGNGRTGTLLACFAICAGLPQATKLSPLEWIRKHYCDAAVESLDQKDYLTDFELWFRGQKKDNALEA